MNTFMNNLQAASNYGFTENGGVTHRTTNSAVYDMFALGGAYRQRSDEDCILLFKNAYLENPTLALKCLFYLRDCRGGQGERRFFRVCFRWLANHDAVSAVRNIPNLAEYGRWDDVIYACIDTRIEKFALDFIKTQLNLDIHCKTPSLLGKWMPSINASSLQTKRAGKIMCQHLHMTEREYRKTLSKLRERINVLERLMSANRWDEIEFDKIPSRAGLIYKNAFARRDIIAKKYEAFAKDASTKVNASVLYPYEVVHKATQNLSNYWYDSNKCRLSDTDRAMIEKYWECLPDYLEGKDCKMLCVVDTSGSMTGESASAPINVAIGLGMYCAERVGGAFKDHYISFSSRPQLIKIEGVDFVDKVRRIYDTNLCENTDLVKTFELIRETAMYADPADRPETVVVISDMEIDYGTATCGWRHHGSGPQRILTEMEREREVWEDCGMEMPKLVYWNVNARNNNILDLGPDVSYVSGMSPIIFKQVLTGVTGYELMMQTLFADRYNAVK